MNRTLSTLASSAVLGLIAASASLPAAADSDRVFQAAPTESGYIIVNPSGRGGDRKYEAVSSADASAMSASEEGRVIRTVRGTESGYTIVSPSGADRRATVMAEWRAVESFDRAALAVQ